MSTGKQVRNLAVIQARVGSSRLPNKVMLDLEGKSVLERVVDRVRKSSLVDDVIVATTIEPQDLAIVKLCADRSIRVFCGSENDVLDRYYQAAKLIQPENVIRITADCPLIDPSIINKVITAHLEGRYDYTSNVLRETFPDGEDVEIMTFEVLKRAWAEANMASQREHVTQYIIHNDKFKKHNVSNEYNLSDKRWTLDNEEDYELIREIYHKLSTKHSFFGMKEILDMLNEDPELEKINSNIERNEGLTKSLNNDSMINE